MAQPRSLFEKIWDRHSITTNEAGQSLLFIDRHFCHELSFHAFNMLHGNNRTVRHPERTFAIPDHYTPTTGLDDADYVRLVRNSLNWLFKADKVTANPTRVMFGNNTDNKDYEYHNKILPLIELDAVILEYAETEEIVTPTSQPIIYTPTDGMLLPTKADEINYVLGQLGELSYMEWRNTTWRAIEFLGIEGLNIMKSYYPEQDKNEYKALFTSWSNAKTPHWNGIYKAHNINWYEAQDYVLEQSNKRQKELK